MATTTTTIEWTDRTWNPTTGCDKVSPGCKHCYAEAVTKRFRSTFRNGFKFTLHQERLDLPKTWRQPSMVFVNSMSDLFHEQLPLDFLTHVFDVMRDCPQHTFQLLTKRHGRLAEIAEAGILTWPDNVWVGVSVENQRYVERVDYLRRVPAAVRFLSCEPLLGPLELDLTGIDWVITGGESGPKRRPVKAEWVRSIRDQCLAAGVPFFHKQWGGRTPSSNGRELDGRIWHEFPEALERQRRLLPAI